MFKKLFGSKPEYITELETLLREDKATDVLLKVKDYFTAKNHDPVLYGLAGSALKKIGSPEEAKLFNNVKNKPKKAQSYFDLGYHFMEVNRPGLAEPILERASELSPGDMNILLELALSRGYQQNIKGASEAVLSIPNKNNIIVLYVMARYSLMQNQTEVAEAIVAEILEKFESGDLEDKQFLPMFAKLNDALNRLKIVGSPETHIRDWYYILYGNIVLDFFENEDDYVAGGRYVAVFMNYESIKIILDRFVATWAHFKLETDIEVVTSIGTKGAEIMGGYLAKVLNLKHQHLSFPENGRAIMMDEVKKPNLVVAESNNDFNCLYGGHDLEKKHIFFALYQDWFSIANFSADFIGNVNQSVTLPWNGGGMKFDQETKKVTVEEADSRSVEEIASFLTKIELPEDSLAELDLDWYKDKLEYLTVNPQKIKSKTRVSYDQVLPVPGAQFG